MVQGDSLQDPGDPDVPSGSRSPFPFSLLPFLSVSVLLSLSLFHPLSLCVCFRYLSGRKIQGIDILNT